MANARKYGYFKPVKKDTKVKWRRLESKVPGRKRQEVDRNAQTLGKQLRV